MKTSLFALAMALTIAAPAFAEEAAEAPQDSILVVGQTDKPIEIAPRGLAVSLGAEQLAAVNAFNTEDLMKYAPNFFVRKRYSGDSNGVPGFRGTHSTQSARTLVMVDGFVVSNFLGNSFGFAPKWGVVGPGEVEQFDIVYGPYSSRYVGNSMGGIVNITTRDPERTEAFATVQGFVQPYRQFGTKDDYYGYSGEAGLGWKQKDGPFSLRVTGRFFRNEGQPMMWYGLVPTTGAAGTAVTGGVIDPNQVEAINAGTGLANLPPTLPGQPAQATPAVPGSPTNPIFAAQSPARITQAQAKLKLGYDDGTVTGQFLFAYWHNEDRQTAPDCYLRDAAGNTVCEGRVTIGSQTYTASGAVFSKTLRDEFLAGAKLGAPIAEDTTARLAVSTYQIARSDGFTSNGYVTGRSNGAGTLASQGPTGWWTADLTIENKTDRRELALGFTGNAYRTDQTRYTLANWTSDAGKAFSTRTFGKSRQLSAWAEARLLFDPLTVTLGTRYDNWRAYDGGLTRLNTASAPVSNTYAARQADSVDPSLSFEYRIDAATQIQLSLAMATRYPTVGELFQGSLNGDGTFNANSFDINLKPERSKDANLLIAHDFGPIKLTGSAFWQRVKNTIFQFYGFNQNGISSSTYKNIDLTRQFGFELIAQTKDWPLPGMAIDANAAYIDSKTIRNASNPTAEGVQFPRIPKWRINANLRYDVTPAVEASLGMRYASRPNTDLFGLQRGDTYGFTSELFALDLRVNWKLTDQLRLSAGVDNLTNDRAWVFHPYPQRTFLVEAGWRL
ncbi:TonB-dependent receptor [Novosphingobium sp. JCM 18896]|uniref:TonB-dependent receptor n=1 Tax=Novosphingobium sp. JCM 18896 TaxID=2989731 RepID=UPI00222156F4|nr:TonB-dependent receptor [Novosphingobium sp. JCM 18896]MCW1429917.1 TonB-dependent receptor [Novosphingobium sp. JCM 18896]